MPDAARLRGKYAVEADSQLCGSYEMLLKELGRLEKNSFDRMASPVSAIETFAKVTMFVRRIIISI
jgi:hypothetical protein